MLREYRPLEPWHRRRCQLMGGSAKLNLGIIGLGQAGAMVIDSIKQTPDLPWQLVAGADPRPQARDSFAAEFGRAFPHAESLCRNGGVDAVYIASPSWLHAEHVEIAAHHGKHIVCEKPIALSVPEGVRLVEAARRGGIALLAGHTHSFDAPIVAMARLVQSGELGAIRSINCWNYNEFNHRPRPLSELKATHGPVLNQGPHHVDIVRQICGAPLRSVRATTIPDGVTGVEGGYTALLQFENGVPATIVYDGRSLFDTAELFDWVGESGGRRNPASNAQSRSAFEALMHRPAEERDRELDSGKESGRYGGATAGRLANALVGYETPYQPFFGLNVVACENGAIRQSPSGLYVYTRDGRSELPVDQSCNGRIAELVELHEAIVSGRPPFHDGAWGLATLEVCFAMLESADTGKEVFLNLQASS